MAGKLENRRVLLTGVSRGVGLAVAKAFLKEGAEVLGSARDPGRLEEARVRLNALAPGQFSAMAADLADPKAPQLLADAARERWGALDILMNNAGVMLSHKVDFESEHPGTLERSLEINLLAPLRLSLACLPLLRRGREPRILQVGSGAGDFASIGTTGIPSYRLSKWALHGLTLQLAAQLAPDIAVNAFDPGWVKTDLGGPDAPGSVVESAAGALALATLPMNETGKFYKNGKRISF